MNLLIHSNINGLVREAVFTVNVSFSFPSSCCFVFSFISLFATWVFYTEASGEDGAELKHFCDQRDVCLHSEPSRGQCPLKCVRPSVSAYISQSLIICWIPQVGSFPSAFGNSPHHRISVVRQCGFVKYLAIIHNLLVYNRYHKTQNYFSS